MHNVYCVGKPLHVMFVSSADINDGTQKLN